MTPLFDFTPYRFTLDDSGMAMDELHIQMLRAAVDLCPDGCTAVEIGSYKGASTAALIDALNAGKIGSLMIVEIMPTIELHRVIAMADDPAKVQLFTVPFWELPLFYRRLDFVFIDGSHDWPALADTLKAVTLGADVICMHDSNSEAAGYPGTWGSKMAADCLKLGAGRQFFEDSYKRVGMKTERGFLVSATGAPDFTRLYELE